MKVRITNCGEGNSTIIQDVSEQEYEFLVEIAKKLNENTFREKYSPLLIIEEEFKDGYKKAKEMND